MTWLAQALTEPKAQQIIDRALVEATILWNKKFVLFFMERLWPRPQPADEGLMRRLEDLKRWVMALEMRGSTGPD